MISTNICPFTANKTNRYTILILTKKYDFMLKYDTKNVIAKVEKNLDLLHLHVKK